MSEPRRPVFDPLGLVRRLSEFEVEYVVVGGVSARAQGYAQTTNDFDLVPEPSEENLDRLARALSGEQTKKFSRAWKRVLPNPLVDPREFSQEPVATTYYTAWGRVDILREIPGVGDYARLNKAAKDAPLGQGVRARVASLDDLIVSKETLGRAKDLAQLPALYEAQRTLEERMRRSREGPTSDL